MLVYDYKIDTGYAVERICKQTFRKLGVALFFLKKNLHIGSNSESTFKDLKQVEIRGSPIELGLKDWDPLVMTNKHSHGLLMGHRNR
jgi:transposase